ncbi:hypothetical protein E2C01_072164 [Portunus trituberculatus]|uniref:Uncharacterized protein n=1 Tax=Portunus trituberculatus TaxID=210409 RepID=A0A5B7I1W9_PORTR|nr:hypothetical protein [Portunus trituberculatus]
MTQIVSSSAVKQQIAMTLLMAPSQPSHFLKKRFYCLTYFRPPITKISAWRYACQRGARRCRWDRLRLRCPSINFHEH